MTEHEPSRKYVMGSNEIGWNPDWETWDTRPVIEGFGPETLERIYADDSQALDEIVATLKALPADERDQKILFLTGKIDVAQHYLHSQIAALDSYLDEAAVDEADHTRKQIEEREAALASLQAAEDRLFTLYRGPRDRP